MFVSDKFLWLFSREKFIRNLSLSIRILIRPHCMAVQYSPADTLLAREFLAISSRCFSYLSKALSSIKSAAWCARVNYTTAWRTCIIPNSNSPLYTYYTLNTYIYYTGNEEAEQTCFEFVHYDTVQAARTARHCRTRRSVQES